MSTVMTRKSVIIMFSILLLIEAPKYVRNQDHFFTLS